MVHAKLYPYDSVNGSHALVHWMCEHHKNRKTDEDWRVFASVELARYDLVLDEYRVFYCVDSFPHVPR